MSCGDSEKRIMINLAEQFVIRKPENFERDEGIHFCLKIDLENYGYEKDGSTYHEEWRNRQINYLHYVVAYPHSVFFAVGESENLPPGALFRNTSNHDSCWRSDGFSDIHSCFFEMYDAVYGYMPNEHKPIPLACHYNIHLCTKWLNGPVFDFVKLKTESGHNYGKDVIEIKKIEKTITF